MLTHCWVLKAVSSHQPVYHEQLDDLSVFRPDMTIADPAVQYRRWPVSTSLYVIRWRTGSQWNCNSIGCLYALRCRPLTVLATWPGSRWNRSRTLEFALYRGELPSMSNHDNTIDCPSDSATFRLSAGYSILSARRRWFIALIFELTNLPIVRPKSIWTPKSVTTFLHSNATPNTVTKTGIFNFRTCVPVLTTKTSDFCGLSSSPFTRYQSPIADVACSIFKCVTVYTEYTDNTQIICIHVVMDSTSCNNLSN